MRQLVLLVSGFILNVQGGHAGEVPAGLLGDWSLELSSKEPSWLRIVDDEQNGPLVYLRIFVGPKGPFKVTKIEDGEVHFLRLSKKNTKAGRVSVETKVQVGLIDGQLSGKILRPSAQGIQTVTFTGEKIPMMPKDAPDLSKVKFGEAISLFNGKNLDGWRPNEFDKINGWSVEGGLLVNKTTKTDFSATGDHANLRTVAEFTDFKLYAEFLIEENRNSGIYLRGMYEAQVVDRDSRMQGKIGPGSIFGEILPTRNAGKAGGQWQSYELTLVDRHVTVVLNGITVIDNHAIDQPTAGAIVTHPMKPGPIYLQGDHTAVKYRNIYLSPVVK
ncbi:MAG: 3-keto-disaccharide hydrolase [Akkermansiaceae bacterium]